MTKFNDKVVSIGTITSLDIPVEDILDNAPRDLQSVMVMGFDKDGATYFASSNAEAGDVMWLMEVAKKHLLEISMGEELH